MITTDQKRRAIEILMPLAKRDLTKVFCATGPGGGVDPTCSPGEGSKSNWNSIGGTFGLPPATDDPAPGGKYFYHGTAVTSLDSIAAEGIRGDRQMNLVSVAPHLDSAHFWTSAGAGGDNIALLRFSSKKVHTYNEPEDEYDPEHETAETAVRPVKPEILEVYHNGEWKPLKR